MINIFDAKHRKLNAAKILTHCLAFLVCTAGGWNAAQESAPGPIKVFILAGDENVLEQGDVGGGHPKGNAESCLEIGEAMGRAILELVDGGRVE